MASKKRLMRELKNICDDTQSNISVVLDNDDIFNWVADFPGPKDSPYEEGTFTLSISFDDKYPFKPPSVIFLTKVYHPNISKSGDICIDILKDKWTSSLSAKTIILSISALLDKPNPEDPLRQDVAKIYMSNYNEFVKKAKRYTEKYAT